MHTAHKIALDPNNAQITAFRKHAGADRVAYNHALADFKDGLDEGVWRSGYDLDRRFNACKREAYPWLAELNQQAARNAILALARSISNWQAAKKAGRHAAFPRRRTRRKRGMRFEASSTGRITTDGKRVRLPKIGWVRMREAPRFDVPVRRCFISEVGGRWFAALTYEMPDTAPALTEPPSDDATLGIDVGVKSLAVLSDGTVIRNPKPLRAAQRRLRMLNKRLARRKRGSKRRELARNALAKQHARVSNIRKDQHHKTTTAIAKRPDVSLVGIEDLAVANLSRNRHLSRAFADASVSAWLRMLEYKCAREGIRVERVSRWLPSSKTCSDCGWINHGLTLAQRKWGCGGCGVTLDRDHNAAINVKKAAGLAVSGRGDCVRPTFGSPAVVESSTESAALRS